MSGIENILYTNGSQISRSDSHSLSESEGQSTPNSNRKLKQRHRLLSIQPPGQVGSNISSNTASSTSASSNSNILLSNSASQTSPSVTAAVRCSPTTRTLFYSPRFVRAIGILLLSIVVLCCIQTVHIVRLRQQIVTAHALSSYPSISDLSIVVIYLLVILAARAILVPYAFKPLGNKILPSLEEKREWNVQSRNDRIDRFSTVCFKFLYFVFAVLNGYRVLRSTSWLPPALGGNGDLTECWKNYPFDVITDELKHYYLCSFAYHLHSLLVHISSRPRNDWWEMTIHHVSAVLLVLFSYYYQYTRIGSVILFLHDIADIFGYAVKATVDTKYVKLTLSIYLGLLVSWGYTRLYVFPVYVLHSSLIHTRIYISPHDFYAFTYWCIEIMLVILQLLHIYWYALFIIMGYMFLKSGKAQDIQQKAGQAKDYVDVNGTYPQDEDQDDDEAEDEN